jgi:hypothetical protein
MNLYLQESSSATENCWTVGFMSINSYKNTELLHRELCLVTFYFTIFIHNLIKIVNIYSEA